MLVTHPLAASNGLNPAADEYIPIHHHQVPALAGTGTELLPPPPLKFVPRLFYHPPPPPPPFLSAKLLPSSLARPVQIVWAPVTYAYTTPGAGYPPSALFDTGKDTAAPALKRAHRILEKAPAICDSKVNKRRPTFPEWRRALPPRHLARKSAARRMFSRRKNGAAAPATDEQPEADVYPFGDCTTLMIRNIPNRLSRSELMKLLAEHCSEMNKEATVKSEYDLVYLPVDFDRLGNKGYAFVNFTSADGAAGLYRAWNNLRWDKFGYESKKIRVITTAKFQGKEKLKAHLVKSLFECHTDDYLPVELMPPCNGSNLSAVAAATIGSRVKSVGRRREN